MRFLKESLLSFFVLGVVLWLYFVAAIVVLLSLHRGREGQNQRDFETAAAFTVGNRTHSLGELP
jgi:hypothetical protein